MDHYYRQSSNNDNGQGLGEGTSRPQSTGSSFTTYESFPTSAELRIESNNSIEPSMPHASMQGVLNTSSFSQPAINSTTVPNTFRLQDLDPRLYFAEHTSSINNESPIPPMGYPAPLQHVLTEPAFPHYSRPASSSSFTLPLPSTNSPNTNAYHSSAMSTPPLSMPTPVTVPIPDGVHLMEARAQSAAEQYNNNNTNNNATSGTKRTSSEMDSSSGLPADDSQNGSRRKLFHQDTEPAHSLLPRVSMFQETSEESFEHSLMNGGYGVYRTDWSDQSKPHSITPEPPALTISEAPPPTEKELKKRKRLAAFRDSSDGILAPIAKLTPVEFEGRGRVLLDLNHDVPPTAYEMAQLKKKAAAALVGGNKRKKKGSISAEAAAREKALLDRAQRETELLDRPNWPDSEFPWRLRTEERVENARLKDEERLKCIEKFLDRDTDDEEEPEEEERPPSAFSKDPEDDDDIVNHDRSLPYRGLGDSSNPDNNSRNNAYFPSDPADARAALLSKKSVRTLSYRQQRKKRDVNEEESEDEIVCICNGKDDGRELVQCDKCSLWYHLSCIGIRNIAELGREEDPWFCKSCMAENRESEPSVLGEPTFVPTEVEPLTNRTASSDTFLQTFSPDSPAEWNTSQITNRRYYPPTTPTRGEVYDNSVRVYTDSSFDHPTSTPGRSMMSFLTPKSSNMSSIHADVLQTPSKPSRSWNFYNKDGHVDSLPVTPFNRNEGLLDFTQEESPVIHARTLVKISSSRSGGDEGKQNATSQ